MKDLLIFHAEDAPKMRRDALRARGAECVSVPRSAGGLCWGCMLAALDQRAVATLLVEGGSAVAASLLEAGQVDVLSAFVAPKIIGDCNAPGLQLLTATPERMEQALHLRRARWRRVGQDVLLRAAPPSKGLAAVCHHRSTGDGKGEHVHRLG